MGHPVGIKLFLYDVYDMVCIIIYVFCIEKTLSIEDFHLFPFIMNVKGTRFREKNKFGREGSQEASIVTSLWHFFVHILKMIDFWAKM